MKDNSQELVKKILQLQFALFKLSKGYEEITLLIKRNKSILDNPTDAALVEQLDEIVSEVTLLLIPPKGRS